MSTPSWSESAFGVVHKSYRKMRPKYVRAVERGIKNGSIKHHDMDARVRYNYAGMRLGSGDLSRVNLGGQEKLGRTMKEYSNAQVTAAGNLNREKRKLP